MFKRNIASTKEALKNWFQVDPEFAHLPIKDRFRLSHEKRLTKSSDERKDNGAWNTKVESMELWCRSF